MSVYYPGRVHSTPLLSEDQKLVQQSPFLYVESSASNGDAFYPKGIFVRGAFLDDLGEYHLPKGLNLDFFRLGYNKRWDFVHFERAVFYKDIYRNFPTIIDFGISPPSQIINSGNDRFWIYENVIIPRSFILHFKDYTPLHRSIIVRFKDKVTYDQKVQGKNLQSNNDRIEFLKEYRGKIMEIEAIGSLGFFFQIKAGAINGLTGEEVKIETISKEISFQSTESYYLSSRNKTVTPLQNDFFAMEENIKTVRFTCENCFPQKIYFITYEDFLNGITKADSLGWRKVGLSSHNTINGGSENFSLSVINCQGDLSTTASINNVPRSVIYDRLMMRHGLNYSGSGLGPIQSWSNYSLNQWNKFKDNHKVILENYVSKWNDPNGMRDAIQQYLLLSTNDLKAWKKITSDNITESRISYLDMLKIASLDFHIARMLGLGFIDLPEDAFNFHNLEQSYDINNQAFVYLIRYNTTREPIPFPNSFNYIPKDFTHIYMALPVSYNNLTHNGVDYDFNRFPQVPELKSIETGLTGSDGKTKLTDENGYHKYENIRYAKLQIDDKLELKQVKPFFDEQELFRNSRVSKTVGYGIEYKKTSETEWKIPEALKDYYDQSGNYEIVSSFNNKGKVFVHELMEEGDHEYRVYPIDWFSRSFGYSNTRDLLNTIFPSRKKMIPPSNINAHLIQPEDPPMYTTADEQSNQINKVKILFDWGPGHNIAYNGSNRKVELLFNHQDILEVQGKIADVVHLSDTEAKIITSGYNITSAENVLQVLPVIQQADISSFIGSILCAGEEEYLVKDITLSLQPGNLPEIVVYKNLIKKINHPDPSDKYVTSAGFKAPVKDEIFSLKEKPGASSARWGVLSKKVDIADFTPLHTESIIDDGGKETTLYIGGIFHDNASVVQQATPGLYLVTFTNHVLAPHPDPDISWEKGTLRLKDTSGKFKQLEVWQMQDTNPLTLVAYDSLHEEDVQNENYAIQTGNNLSANYHPSYKLYLQMETAPSPLNLQNILPEGDDESKLTHFILRSEVNDPSNGLIMSDFSVSVPLSAKKIFTLNKPADPVGLTYATRPDVYGKSSFTFETDFTAQAYAMLFLRSNEVEVLNVLYKPETISDILAELATKDENSMVEIWQYLLNVQDANDLDVSGTFKEIQGFTFPNPDNPYYIDPDSNIDFKPFDVVPPPNPSTVLEHVIQAIYSAFMPLTETPVVLRNVKKAVSGTFLATSSEPPVIKDEKGHFLPEELAKPYPMAIITSNPEKIRFTDYFIDGASDNIFFYCTIEMDNQFNYDINKKSKVLGPVQTINTMPPLPPLIKSVVVEMQDLLIGTSASVKFEIEPYLASENVTQIMAYRTTDESESVNVRMMKALPVSLNANIFVDDFQDLNFVPFGEMLYYRLVAYREITNEDGNPELIPSYPSEVIKAQAIDNLNPLAPEITPSFTVGNNKLESVVFSWDKTVHNGKYYLYKMNDQGNWYKIHEIASNDALIEVDLSNTDLQTDILPTEDQDGDPLYHRFKIMVENASGLMNIEENELTIP